MDVTELFHIISKQNQNSFLIDFLYLQKLSLGVFQRWSGYRNFTVDVVIPIFEIASDF